MTRSAVKTVPGEFAQNRPGTSHHFLSSSRRLNDVSMSSGIPTPARLEQEPGAPLRFVNPDLDEAGGGDVLMFFADAVGLAQTRRQGLIVLAQLSQHVLGLDILGIVVQHR